jgi:hypothetical protein
MKLFTALIGLATIVGTALGLMGSQNTGTHLVTYNVNIPQDVNFIPVKQIMTSGDTIYAPFDGTHQIGDIITSTNPNIIARVTDIQDNYTIATRVGIHSVIQNGTISVRPISKIFKPIRKLMGTAEKDVPFCYGFNTKDCKTPQSTIPIFQNKYLDLDCDNCFAGFSGDAFAEIEIDWFKIKNVAGGFKNLDLQGGLGVNLEATAAPSYAFDKTYPVITKYTIASFNIGPIPVDLWLELPVEVSLNAGLDAAADAQIGANINFGIGNIYFQWNDKSGFQFFGPSDNLNITPYLKHSVSLNGESQFKIFASMKLHLDNVFEVQADITPQIDATLNDLCLDGKYQFQVDYQGTVMKDTFGPKTIFDSGSRSLVHICA